MKKIFINLTALFFAVIFLTNCHRYNENEFLCDCGKVEIEKKDYIAMCVLPREVTINSENYLRIENHTRNILGYGHDFSLEYFDENNWVSIQLDILWEHILLGIDPGKSLGEKVDCFSLIKKYNDSKNGKYRIHKHISLAKDDRMLTHIGSYHLYAEFEIK